MGEMTELIRIIVIICKIGSGNVNMAETQYEKEAKCAKQLINCMDKDDIWTSSRLKRCMKNRK